VSISITNFKFFSEIKKKKHQKITAYCEGKLASQTSNHFLRQKKEGASKETAYCEGVN